MSSSDYAIRIKGIGKQYRLGLEQAAGMYRYKSLRDSLGGIVRSPLKTARALLPEPLNESNSFWALKDVSFDVKRGEVVGIIGRNGAGKSTLLKILSRITRPTTGEIELHGRVGSLLEVGTGFHPELSGRENIYLNGAVLGMTRAEVKSKFDEIVAFSEIEKFLDTPVKHYSSGMYTRLAFAVAAHLEPEILVVDEVLAVGDAEFQKKCLGKMKDVAEQGRTVLFVSHNVAAVSNMCNRAIVLSGGCLRYAGPTPDAINCYRKARHATFSETAAPGFTATNPSRWIRSAHLVDFRHFPTTSFPLGTDLTIVMEFASPSAEHITTPVMGVVIRHRIFGVVGGINTLVSDFTAPRACTKGIYQCTLRAPPLIQGAYLIDLWLTDGHAQVDKAEGALAFTIEDADVFGTGKIPNANLGVMYFVPSWTCHTRA